MTKLKKKKSSDKLKGTKTKQKKVETMEDAINALSSEFDITVMSSESEEDAPYFIPFKHAGLQAITGGCPGGKMIMIEGDSQSGKSYLAYELMESCNNLGGKSLLNDTENAFEKKFGTRVGLLEKDKNFTYSKERDLVRVFKMYRKWILTVRSYDKNCPILISMDSFPATIIKVLEKELDSIKAAEMKGYMAARKNAQLAELLSEFVGFIAKHKVTFVVINQLRKKMGVMFGDPTTVNAEDIFKYYVNLRIRGRLGKKIKTKVSEKNKADARQVGVKSTWETLKNRSVDPFKKVELSIKYKTGISPSSGILELLRVEGKIIYSTKDKDQFIYNKKRYNKDNIMKFIEKYPEVLNFSD